MSFRRILCLWITISFVSTLIVPPQQLYAQTVLDLPAPGTMVSVSPSFEPALIRGLTVHQDNPFLFDFIVDPGQSKVPKAVLKDESERMIKYFFASLTIPDKDIWVNLSPYEKDRMIPQSLGVTAMGRDLLAQDYMLKQLTASLINPQQALGETFWAKVYAKAKEMYGTTEIPVNTFNKVWIVPQKAGIYEHNQTAFIVNAHLKVMLEEDYLSLAKHNAISNSLSSPNASVGDPEKAHTIASQIIRSIILPEIEQEINEGKNFATLRQIFYAQVLAVWFKRNLKQALLTQVYANKSTVKGIERPISVIPAKAGIQPMDDNEAIYQQYLRAYKKGVFNYIKEDIDPVTQETFPRKYFSGGYAPGSIVEVSVPFTSNAMISAKRSEIIAVFAAAGHPSRAMVTNLLRIMGLSAVAVAGLALSTPVTLHAQPQQQSAADAIESQKEIAKQLALFNKFHPEEFGFLKVGNISVNRSINVWRIRDNIKKGSLVVDETSGEVYPRKGPGELDSLERTLDKEYKVLNMYLYATLTAERMSKFPPEAQVYVREILSKSFLGGRVKIANVSGLTLSTGTTEALLSSETISVSDDQYYLGGITPQEARNLDQKLAAQGALFKRFYPQQYGLLPIRISVKGKTITGQVDVNTLGKRIYRGDFTVDGRTGNILFNQKIDQGDYWDDVLNQRETNASNLPEPFILENLPGVEVPIGLAKSWVLSGVVVYEEDPNTGDQVYYLRGMTPAQAIKEVNKAMAAEIVHTLNTYLHTYGFALGAHFTGMATLGIGIAVSNRLLKLARGTQDLNQKVKYLGWYKISALHIAGALILLLSGLRLAYLRGTYADNLAFDDLLFSTTMMMAGGGAGADPFAENYYKAAVKARDNPTPENLDNLRYWENFEGLPAKELYATGTHWPMFIQLVLAGGAVHFFPHFYIDRLHRFLEGIGHSNYPHLDAGPVVVVGLLGVITGLTLAKTERAIAPPGTWRGNVIKGYLNKRTEMLGRIKSIFSSRAMTTVEAYRVIAHFANSPADSFTIPYLRQLAELSQNPKPMVVNNIESWTVAKSLMFPNGKKNEVLAEVVLKEIDFHYRLNPDFKVNQEAAEEAESRLVDQLTIEALRGTTNVNEGQEAAKKVSEEVLRKIIDTQETFGHHSRLGLTAEGIVKVAENGSGVQAQTGDQRQRNMYRNLLEPNKISDVQVMANPIMLPFAWEEQNRLSEGMYTQRDFFAFTVPEFLKAVAVGLRDNFEETENMLEFYGYKSEPQRIIKKQKTLPVTVLKFAGKFYTNPTDVSRILKILGTVYAQMEGLENSTVYRWGGNSGKFYQTVNYPDAIDLDTLFATQYRNNGVEVVKHLYGPWRLIFTWARVNDALDYRVQFSNLKGIILADTQRIVDQFNFNQNLAMTAKTKIIGAAATTLTLGLGLGVNAVRVEAKRMLPAGATTNQVAAKMLEITRQSLDNYVIRQENPTRDIKTKRDKATITPVGGIDLSQEESALHVTKDANGGVKVTVDRALIARIERDGLPEVDPVIIDMQPADIKSLFGSAASI